VAEIGYALAISGVVAALLQLAVMPVLLKKFRHQDIYHTCMNVWPVVFAVFPLLRWVEKIGDERLRTHILWVMIGMQLLVARVAFLCFL
jgi:hypothetical protein